MFIEKFIEFFDNLIKCSNQGKENKSKLKEEDIEIINDYNLEDNSKNYIEKHIIVIFSCFTLIFDIIHLFVNNF